MIWYYDTITEEYKPTCQAHNEIWNFWEKKIFNAWQTCESEGKPGDEIFIFPFFVAERIVQCYKYINIGQSKPTQ